MTVKQTMTKPFYFFRHVRFFYILSRPLNVFITVISIIIAALITGKFTFSPLLIYAVFTSAFIAAGANIVNDIFDVEIDKINKPNRVLAAGKISTKSAWIYFCAAYVFGLTFAFISNFSMLIIAVLISILLFLYSAYLKRTIIWGNLAVSVAAAATFLYGAQAVSNWIDGIIPAVFALFFHFGREVVKDMQDLEGDLAENAVTFAGRYGKYKSVLLINIVFGTLIILTTIPFFLGIYNLEYLWIVIIGVDLILLSVSVILWKFSDRITLGRISHILKLDMLIGLLSIYIGVSDVGFFS